MIGTINCVYETPCGWCSKFDKKCDRIASCNNTSITNNPCINCEYSGWGDPKCKECKDNNYKFFKKFIDVKI